MRSPGTVAGPYPPLLHRHYRRILDDTVEGRDVLWLFPEDADVGAHVDALRRVASEWLSVDVAAGARWIRQADDAAPRVVRVSGALQDVDVQQVDVVIVTPCDGPLSLAPGGGDGGGAGRKPLDVVVDPEPGIRPPVIVPVLARALGGPVSSGVRFSVRPMWGCTTAADLQRLARELLDDGGDPAYALWATSVWVGLAAFDDRLLAELVAGQVSPPKWRTHLEEYARRRGWADTKAPILGGSLEPGDVWQTALSPYHEDRPPPRMFELWAAGACDWVPGWGLALHSALAVARGWDDLLAHRIWRGQVSVLMPLIDEARLLLARRLGTRPKATGAAVEFADMKPDLVRAVERGSASRGSVEIVAELKRARDTLSHYRYLDWDAWQMVTAALSQAPRVLARLKPN